MSDTVKVVDTGPGAYLCGYEERTLAPGERDRIFAEVLKERLSLLRSLDGQAFFRFDNVNDLTDDIERLLSTPVPGASHE